MNSEKHKVGIVDIIVLLKTENKWDAVISDMNLNSMYRNNFKLLELMQTKIPILLTLCIDGKVEWCLSRH